MSNGEDADDGEDAPDETEPPEPADPAEFDRRLTEANETVEAAETEADLDDAEELLDDIESDLEAATFAVEIEDEEAEEDEKEDEEEEEDEEKEENPRDEFEDRLSDLRDEIEEQRGPYLEEVTDELESAETTISTSEWAKEGVPEVVAAVETFFETAGETLGETFTLESETPDGVAGELASVREHVAGTGLHPDTDEAEIGTLLTAAEDLNSDLEDATLFGDLEVREQLRREGFYGVIEPENRKDFPPELTAIKVYERRGEVEPILSAMEKLDSDFMEDNVLDALEHMASVEAYDQVQGLAQRRNTQAVRIMGRIGDERACGMLHNFLGGGDVNLEKNTLFALGAIGSADSVEPVAERLAAENPEVRSSAARALGRIGDTRAIAPLATLLDEDDSDDVRASAAWALNQIGTERALDAAAEYADDRSYMVQKQAEKATEV